MAKSYPQVIHRAEPYYPTWENGIYYKNGIPQHIVVGIDFDHNI
jgi:hypothetical protein